VERGDDFGIIPKAQAALGEIDANYGVGETVCRAFHGSLDAAKALHDALLPGWEWHLGPSNAKVYPYNGSPLKSWGGMADNPARAWLLAILRALEGATP
jgi:hypothetical protein